MKREPFWDSLKFILIFCVVYGHFILPNHQIEGSFNKAMYNFIYMFHMPLFIFVSGRFSVCHDKKKYINGIIRIAETFIVFHVFEFLWGYMSGKVTICDIFYPRQRLWYLLCLIYWRFIVIILPQKVLRNASMVLLGSFIFSLIGGFMPVEECMSFQRMMSFMPFFFLGYYSWEIDLQQLRRKVNVLLAWGGLIGVFVFVYLFLNVDVTDYLTGKHSYWWDDELCEGSVAIRIITTVSSIFVGLLVMRVTPVKSNIMAKWGGMTMVIYIYHIYMLKIVKVLDERGFLPNSSVAIFIYAVSATLLLVYIGRFQIIQNALNPVSYIVKELRLRLNKKSEE